MPDVQLHELVVVRRIRHGKAAPRAVFEQDVDVLAGKEHEAFIGREFEKEDHGVAPGALKLVHPGGELPHLDVPRFAHLARLDDDVGKRFRLAEKREPALALGRAERLFRVASVVDPALDELALAAAAGTVAATVGNHQARVERSLENALAVRCLELVPGVADGDLMRHRCAG